MDNELWVWKCFWERRELSCGQERLLRLEVS
jgi:hypothetical protein